jgi:hypothetical protein
MKVDSTFIDFALAGGQHQAGQQQVGGHQGLGDHGGHSVSAAALPAPGVTITFTILT